MSRKPKLCIRPKDISIIFDISARQANRRYQQVKDAFGRLKHQEITFREFAEYFGLNLDEVYQQLKH